MLISCYNFNMRKNKNLFYKEFLDRENFFLRASFVPESEFYSAIKSGNVRQVRKLCEEPLDKKTGLGVLSKNPVRNLKYHFVITAAMVARKCIEGGMEYSHAYTISDMYILRVDSISDVEEISALHKKMCLEYATQMRIASKKMPCSKYVSACLNYIYENLHEKICVGDLAKISGLSESYISRLFHKETGLKIQEYVLQQKIEASKNMLLYTDRALSEIALILGFPNQSYWTQAFRRLTGTTHAKYRTKASAFS